MIKEPTVLIVGAGAASPYGFPVGTELVAAICTKLSRDNHSTAKAILRELGFSDNSLHLFAEELAFSHSESIDAFLQHRKGWRDLGKAAIASVLLPYERQTKLFEKPDWYHRVLKTLRSSMTTPMSQLTIVTFNYDRSLEWYLYLTLKNSFGLAVDEAASMLRSIRIIHVYGSLGLLHPLHENGLIFGQPINKDVVDISRKSIRIIHEENEDVMHLREIWNEIYTAKRVCFLGFGYHASNMKRLFPDHLDLPSSTEFLGTAYGISGAEKNKLQERLPFTISFGHALQECDAFLKEHAFFGF